MKIKSIFTTLLLSAVATATYAADLMPGSKAPAITVKTWVKGKPVTGFKPGKTYVVEFWATWCGPCIDSIPHLTELAKKNKDVQFLGVSIWEDNKNQEVQKFVKKMGAKMDYTVAFGGNKEAMSKNWMEASGSNGIPTAFIVKDQKIAWIGHPMAMDSVLPKVKSGKFDMKKARADFQKQMEESKAEMAVYKDVAAIEKMYKDGKKEEAAAKLTELEGKSEVAKAMGKRMRFQWMADGDYAKWEATATSMARSGDMQEISALYECGMKNANPKGNRTIATKVAELLLSSADPKDALYFYFAATIQDGLGETDKALAAADKAVAALPLSEFKDDKQAIEAITKMRDDISKKKG